jgi:hypothetical protein
MRIVRTSTKGGRYMIPLAVSTKIIGLQESFFWIARFAAGRWTRVTQARYAAGVSRASLVAAASCTPAPSRPTGERRRAAGVQDPVDWKG